MVTANKYHLEYVLHVPGIQYDLACELLCIIYRYY